MSDIAIKVENLSKRYRIGLKDEIHDTFAGALTSFIRSPVQNLRRLRRLTSFDEKNSKSDIRNSNSDDIIWALRDVSFEVKAGEVVGIIGRNGAGKTTLLKILSRITEPTSGRAEIYGRVSSLLEVGTGFHPELTGRENIYLNGTILGMRKAEIDRKFDQIVDFSGVEKFIDTPVKRYSSGMSVRLAFSVAAHLEPEILLVDEVLAVGDAEFQKKCLGKMGEVAREGRTVLFVSHNIGAILQLCIRSVLLAKGQAVLDSDTNSVVSEYLAETSGNESIAVFEEDPSLPAQILSMSVISTSGKPINTNPHTRPFAISLNYLVKKWNVGSYVCLDVFNEHETRLLWSSDVSSIDEMTVDRQPGTYQALVTIPGDILSPGRYSFTSSIVTPGQRTWGHTREKAISMEITDGGSLLSNFGIKPHSATMIPLTWDVKLL